MKGFVYLLKESGDDLLHKIGVTCASDVEKRIKKLQTGNGNKIVLVSSFLSNNPFKLEKMLHNYYALDREEGEWFLMNKEQTDDFLVLCNKFENTIDFLKRENPYF